MRRVQVSVGSLVEAVIHSGDLNLDFRESALPIEGVRAQKKVQRARPDHYQREVWITHQVERDGFDVKIQGRIDGVFLEDDPVTLEEIKATRRQLEDTHRLQGEQHWGQLRCYAYFYALQNDLPRVRGRLTYYHLDSGKTREEERNLPLDELRVFFTRVLDRFLQRIRTLDAWRRRRDGSIRSLDFPHLEYRPGQRRLAVASYRAIRDREQLLVQAPTGLGKSAGTIFPALKALGEGLASRVFFLTARTTGRAAAEGQLDLLRGQGLQLRSVSLTAKSKICFNPDRSCTGEECAFARGFYDRIDDAVDSALTRSRLTRTEIEAIALRHQVCPFELSLHLAESSDMVVCDYNYVFDPRAFLRSELEETQDRVLIIDEAHNLVDRSREMFSAELSKQSFRAARRAVRKEFPRIGKLLWRLNRWFSRLSSESSEWVEASEPEGVEPLLRKFAGEAEKCLSEAGGLAKEAREAFLEAYFQALGFLRVIETFRSESESYVWCFRKLEDTSVKLHCLDPAGQVGGVLQRYRSSIFCSATLEPLAYFRRLLGCGPTARGLRLESPFAAEQVCFLLHDRIDTRFRSREKSCEAVVAMLGAFSSQRTGNYLFFFPSYDYLELVHAAFLRRFPEIRTLVQQSGMEEPDRDAFLEELSGNPLQTVAGFTVLGGIFGESIDLTGDRLSGAAIVSVGLPGLSIERDQLRSYFTGRGEPGFELAYALPGMNRVLQAAGRVIRTEADRGAILLIDPRYRRDFYCRLLPREWRPRFVPGEEALRELLGDFWNPLARVDERAS